MNGKYLWYGGAGMYFIAILQAMIGDTLSVHPYNAAGAVLCVIAYSIGKSESNERNTPTRKAD